MKSVLIFLNAATYSSVASPGAGACEAEIVPANIAALVAAGTPLAPRMVWNVVASAPTLITTHLEGLYAAAAAVAIATAVAEATAAMITTSTPLVFI